MPEEAEVAEQEEVDISKKVEKEEMISFLTSTGKIKEEFAGTLYDQGLDSWKVLIEGTEDYFTGLKRVGPARAKVLLDLASMKKEEMGTSKPGLKEVLETIPRMSQRIISALHENGYASFESFKEKTAEDLEQIKGIGPKMSVAIIKAVNDHIEIYGAEDAEVATAEMVEEEGGEEAKDERSLIQRIVDAISGLLGGKKKEEKESAPEEGKPEEAEEEEKVEEPAEEPPEEKEPAQEEEKPEEAKEEEPVEEAPKEEEPEGSPEEEKIEEPPEETEEEKEPKTSEEAAEEEPKEEVGFFGKLKAKLFGGPKKEETPERKEEEDEEKTPSEDEAVGEEVKEEEPPEEEKGAPESEEAPEKVYENFEDIPGVSKKTAEMLKGAGYLNVDELREAVPEDLTMIDGIGPKTAEKICNALQK